MHDIKEIRKNLDFYQKKDIERGRINISLNELLSLDKKNRDLIQKKENLESKKDISKSQDKKNYEQSKKLSEEIILIESEREKIVLQIKNYLNNIPNLALDDVPVGVDEKSNKVIKTHGKIKKFFFNKISCRNRKTFKRNDFDTSIKLSGSRFVVLKKNFALLERALINLMLDTHTKKFNYEEISPPIIVNEDVMYGTGQLPKFLEDQFEVKVDTKEKKFLNTYC